MAQAIGRQWQTEGATDLTRTDSDEGGLAWGVDELGNDCGG